MFKKVLPKVNLICRWCSTKTVVESSINIDQLETVRLSLPSYPASFINLRYYDSSAKKKSASTIIATHGSPGSHKDFEYMLPRLLASGYRVIIPNWPGKIIVKVCFLNNQIQLLCKFILGFGVTDSPPDNLYNHFNVERAQLLADFVKALNLKRHNMITVSF